MVRAWSPVCGAIGMYGIFTGWGLVGGLQVVGDVSLKGMIMDSDLFLFLLVASFE